MQPSGIASQASAHHIGAGRRDNDPWLEVARKLQKMFDGSLAKFSGSLVLVLVRILESMGIKARSRIREDRNIGSAESTEEWSRITY